MGKSMNLILDIPKRVVRKVLRQIRPPEQVEIFLNEAINFHTETIFIAIPKNGTTTVRRQLVRGQGAQKGKALIPYTHLDIMQVRDTIYTYLLIESMGSNVSFPTEGAPVDSDLRARSQQLFSSFFKFAAVRNPWARAVSLFNRREGVRVGEKISFETFCENHFYASDTCGHPTLHRNQLDWLCDESGQCVMDYVYRLEEFDTAIGEIAERTDGRVQLEMAQANVNPKSTSKRYRDAYTDYTRRLIEERFAKDIDFFKYTF